MKGALAILVLILAAGCAPRATIRQRAVDGAPRALFVYRGDAEAVVLRGSMTRWSPLPMHLHGSAWEVELALPPGRYEYRIEVRAKGVTRMVIPDDAERVDDDFGSENGVLRVWVDGRAR